MINEISAGILIFSSLSEGLDASLSFIDDHSSSGVALIWVNEKGENSIVVISGANEMLSSEYVHEIKHEILKADLIPW